MFVCKNSGTKGYEYFMFITQFLRGNESEIHLERPMMTSPETCLTGRPTNTWR